MRLRYPFQFKGVTMGILMSSSQYFAIDLPAFLVPILMLVFGAKWCAESLLLLA
jgi:hypothetical protein